MWILLACVVALDALMNPAYGELLETGTLFTVRFLNQRCIFVFITAAAPKCSRGAVNGMSQTSALIARAIRPALETTLFSL